MSTEENPSWEAGNTHTHHKQNNLQETFQSKINILKEICEHEKPLEIRNDNAMKNDQKIGKNEINAD